MQAPNPPKPYEIGLSANLKIPILVKQEKDHETATFGQNKTPNP